MLVVAGGHPPQLNPSDLPLVDVVIAADSGFDHAIALGFRIDVLVGDLDSISKAGLREAEDTAVTIERHPTAKNETDLEIALAAAAAHDPERIIVIGATGGRLDHELANVGVAAGYCSAGRRVELHTVGEQVVFVAAHTVVEVPAPVGTTVSLVPIGAPALGVTTAGLRWPLRNATLSPYGTLGVSNVVSESGATVTLTHGVLAIIANLAAT